MEKGSSAGRWLSQFKRVGWFSWQIRKALSPRRDVVVFGPEDDDPLLTRKAAKR